VTDTNTMIPHDPLTHKQCRTCTEVLLRSHFTADRSKKDGKRSRCRACQRKWNVTNGHAKREQQRKYAAKPENRYKKYKASAESRGFSWDLTRDQFMVHWQKPCVHCGSEIKTIGLDRIDSSVPYQADNVEPCCSTCNRLKSDMLTVDWYAHMELIRKHVRGFVSGAKDY
jgi:hypothetical protein